jgi:cytoplasmic iron level regulating protein YaaA (DUF328/UPF0246 family)
VCAVLVLLPPSEGKTRPRRGGRPVDLATLSFPGLTAVRTQVLDALVALSATPEAVTRLGVGASLAGEVAANTSLRTAPAAPAHKVYSGVLYDALGWAELDAGARRRGAHRVLIASALWGFSRPNDRIPAYRLSMDADLGTGPLAKLWRDAAVEALTAAAGRSGVIVDCRSAPYVAQAPVPASLARRTAAVRVVREGPDGDRTVVSHLAKHTRGELARLLLSTGEPVGSVARLAEVAGRRWTAELDPPPRPGAVHTLTLVLRD